MRSTKILPNDHAFYIRSLSHAIPFQILEKRYAISYRKNRDLCAHVPSKFRTLFKRKIRLHNVYETKKCKWKHTLRGFDLNGSSRSIACLSIEYNTGGQE